MEITAEAQALHDLLLDAVSPEGHPTDCAFCAAAIPEETLVAKTDEEIQAEIEAAVAKATAPLQATINDLTGKLAEKETGDQLAELQGQLDTAVAEATAAKTERDNVLAYLASEHEAAEAAKAAEAVKAERVAAIESIGLFAASPDHVTANAGRWAAMDDAAWDAQLAEFKAIASAHGIEPKAPIEGEPAIEATEPAVSPLTATATATPAVAKSAAEDLRGVLSHRQAVKGLV